MLLYSVRDVLAQEFSAPFLAKNDGVAIRRLQQDLARTPAFVAGDFELWCVGDFDLGTGLVSDSTVLKIYRVPFSLPKSV